MIGRLARVSSYPSTVYYAVAVSGVMSLRFPLSPNVNVGYRVALSTYVYRWLVGLWENLLLFCGVKVQFFGIFTSEMMVAYC